MNTKHNQGFRERLKFVAENSQLYHEIRPGGFIQEMTVNFNGSIVVTGGTTSGVAQGENPGNLLSRFKIDLQSEAGSPYPDGTVKDVFARSILRRRIFDIGTYQPDLSLGAGGLTGAAGTFTINQNYDLRFALPELLRGAETSLNAEQYSQMQLQITTGSKGAMLVGNDRNWDYSQSYVDIYDRRDSSSPNSTDVGVLYESDQIIPIAGPNKRMAIQRELDQSASYLDLLFICEQNNQVLSDGLINKLEVRTGNDQFMDQYMAYAQYDRLKYIEDATQSMTGLVLVKIATDGLLGGVVRPIALTLDVNNPSGANLDRFIVSTRRVILPNEFLPQNK